MRIVIINETYSRMMGYSENALSKALAKLGAEVHLVTSRLPPYYYLSDFTDTYGSFVEERQGPDFEEVDGYMVHYLAHRKMSGYLSLEGLSKKLRELKPNIVQSFVAISWIPLNAALTKPIMHYKLFTGSHTAESAFPFATRETSYFDKDLWKVILTRAFHGRFISLFTNKCYTPTQDCANIAIRFFGVQKQKIELSPLGTDTDIFFPNLNETTHDNREHLRQQFGFDESEIVCIYTGRFTDKKNPLILAKAISRLVSQGEHFRGLFIGEGPQNEYLTGCTGCVVHSFVPFYNLAQYYRASDIGVWPAEYSTSQIDAAACGIPIIISDQLHAPERVDGNGMTYHINNLDDLINVLLRMRDPVLRKQLGDYGAAKMRNQYSWDSIANHRLQDYEVALNNGKIDKVRS